MSERREAFRVGSSRVDDFFYWINERHRIWCRRQAGEPKPWTDDPILQQYKFTNVFRELDRGTLALREMEGLHRILLEPRGDDVWLERAALCIYNAWWYRLFNWHEHAYALGWVTDHAQLYDYMMRLHRRGGRIFTGAHMVRGVGGEPKVLPYLRLAKDVWRARHDLAKKAAGWTTLREAFDELMLWYLMGDFTSYEVACDLRWSILSDATDKMSWGNVGNGAVRGLKRMGLPPTCESMVWLLGVAGGEVADLPAGHQVPEQDVTTPGLQDHVRAAPCPFELREIEHSLCEFDKYVRARTGQGRPRSKYPGV